MLQVHEFAELPRYRPLQAVLGQVKMLQVHEFAELPRYRPLQAVLGQVKMLQTRESAESAKIAKFVLKPENVMGQV